MRESVARCLSLLGMAMVVLVGPVWADYPLFSEARHWSDYSLRAPSSSATPLLNVAADESSQEGFADLSANCESHPGCQCCDDVGSWLANSTFALGGEAYKSLGDTAVPAGVATGFMDSAGFVGGFNTGFALLSDSPVLGQFGASYGIFDLAGRDTVSQSSAEQQAFVTIGLSKRSDILADDRVCWGLVYDQFWAHQWGLRAGELSVGQMRFITGYATSQRHELGVWGAVHTDNDAAASVAGPPLRAMNQYNVYSRFNWDRGAQTMLYVGAHDPADIGGWLIGMSGQAPLCARTSLYGNFLCDLPRSGTGAAGANQMEWNLGVGFIYSWGAKAVSPTVSGRQGLPLLPVANNGSLLITD